jgi:alpha-tubulin suppressor-like RCC1 family protein
MDSWRVAALSLLVVPAACSLIDLSDLRGDAATTDASSDVSTGTCTTAAQCPGGSCDCGRCSHADPSCDQSLRHYDDGACVPGIVTVSDRVNHGCFVRTDGTVWCWGSNATSQLGNPNVQETCTPPWAPTGLPCNRTPVEVLTGNGTPLTGAKAVGTGAGHTCALLADQTVWCWGTNAKGQLGNTQVSATSNVPVQVQTSSGALAGVTAIGVGYFAACAIVGSAGDVFCWGDNSHLQIGNASAGATSGVAVQVGTLSAATTISGGSSHFCASTTSKDAWCWGRGNVLQLGNGNGNDTSTPQKVTFAGSGQVQEMGLGNYFSCARIGQSQAWCWGENRFNSLGANLSSPSADPSEVALTSEQMTIGFNHVEGGDDHACARLSNSLLYCWGGNETGQLGIPAVLDGGLPPTLSYSNVASFSAGYQHTCALTNDNQIFCFGANPMGELGDGTTTPHSTPTLVAPACP